MNPDSSPLPRLTVNIGITGHRRLAPERIPALRRDISAFLRLVMEQVQQLLRDEGVQELVSELYAPEPPRFVLLSSLAEGADCLAAEEALALGYELHAPLPMAREEYEKDFITPESRATYHRLLNEASRSRVFEIRAANPQRGRAYADVAAVLLNHSDVLLALWDGVETEHIAGTSATVEQASRQHLPTVHIHSAGEAPTCIITDGERYADWEARLSKHFRALLLPVEALSDEQDVRFTLSCARQKSLSVEDWFPQYLCLPGLFYRMEKAFNTCLRWHLPIGTPQQPVRPVDGGEAFALRDPEYLRRMRSLFTCFDTFSNAYSARYRSGLLWRYLAPVIAICFLSCALYWRIWFADWDHFTLTLWTAFWFGCQGIFLVVPLILQFLDKQKMWHRKFFSYRVVGEQLRQTMHLGAVGFLTVRSQENTYSESPQRWTAWYYRALMRHEGLPNATVDSRYLLEWLAWTRNDFVVDQLNYHSRRWQREGNMRGRLVRLGICMFAAGVAAAMLRGAFIVLHGSAISMSLASVGTLVFPALAVFFAGFCAYACYAKNQQVSMNSSSTLKVICREMDGFLRTAGYSIPPHETNAPAGQLPRQLHFSHAYKLAEHINDCCKSELLGWEDLISSKGIKGQ